MFRSFTKTLLTTLASVGVLTAQASAQEEQSEGLHDIDIASLDCRTFLRTSGEERDNIVIFIHGYLNGVEGMTKVNLEELALATDAALESCIDNPAANLLDTFRQVRSH
jgi:hypothetical protein